MTALVMLIAYVATLIYMHMNRKVDSNTVRIFHCEECRKYYKESD